MAKPRSHRGKLLGPKAINVCLCDDCCKAIPARLAMRAERNKIIGHDFERYVTNKSVSFPPAGEGGVKRDGRYARMRGLD